MTTPFTDIANLDRVVHEPARLAILTVLASCQDADFMFLQRITGLSKGNLSSHLSRLSDEGMVTINKRFEGAIPQTRASLTPDGRQRITKHWEKLEDLKVRSDRWDPASPTA